MGSRNLEIREDKVYLNGEHVADLVPGVASSNRWMFRCLLEDHNYVSSSHFSGGVWRKHELADTPRSPWQGMNRV